MFLRSGFNYNVEEVSLETGLACLDKSKAQQSQADEADINVIVKRFGVGGLLPQVSRLPEYGDFDVGITDFHEAMNVVRAAGEDFARQPADIRRRFENDPGQYVDFLMDPANIDEAIKLGLAIRKENGNGSDVVVDTPPRSDPGAPAGGGA